MRPSSTGNNGNAPRTRTRGAIRTHLGRKRTGPRSRALRASTLQQIGEVTGAERHRQEQMFDRLLDQFQGLMAQAGETTVETVEKALEAASNGLVAAGEFTADNAERLRQFLRRDLLHRDHPGMTFRTGDITTAGTLTCETCGWTIIASRTTLLPSCPQCGDTMFRKTD